MKRKKERKNCQNFKQNYLYKMNCECCGKEIEIVFGPTKYCTKCSVHSRNLHAIIGRLRRKLKLNNLL